MHVHFFPKRVLVSFFFTKFFFLVKSKRENQKKSRGAHYPKEIKSIWSRSLVLMSSFLRSFSRIPVSVTAKLTSEEAKNADEAALNEPDSWFQKKKKGFDKFNRRARRACRKGVKSQFMFWLIITLVFLNTCVLATEHYRQPPWLDDFQDITNLFFVVLFTFEMFLKMYSLGFQVRLFASF